MQSVRWQCYISYRTNPDGFISSTTEYILDDPGEWVAKWIKFIRQGGHDLFKIEIHATL